MHVERSKDITHHRLSNIGVRRRTLPPTEAHAFPQESDTPEAPGSPQFPSLNTEGSTQCLLLVTALQLRGTEEKVSNHARVHSSKKVLRVK